MSWRKRTRRCVGERRRSYTEADWTSATSGLRCYENEETLNETETDFTHSSRVVVVVVAVVVVIIVVVVVELL